MYVAFLRAVQRRVAKSTASESTFCVTRHFPNKHDETKDQKEALGLVAPTELQKKASTPHLNSHASGWMSFLQAF